MTSRRVSAWLHLLRALGRGRNIEQVRQKSGGWTGNASGAEYGKRSAAAGGSILAMSTAAVCAYAATLPIKSDIFGESEQAKHQVHSDHKLTRRELRFLQFASVEYDDVIYMSPMDFIDSLTLDRPRERVYRRVVKEKELKTMLQVTPPFRKGDKTLFRRLEHQGLISYSEYIFLLTLLTKSKSAFKIAFLMFDDDESGTIEKNEFLTIRNLISTLRSSRNVNSNSPQGAANANADDSQCQLDPTDYHFVVSRHANRLFYGLDSYQIVFAKSEEEVKKQDTTLVLHLFGVRGNGKLSFDEFQKFYENLQEEIMEIEFLEFARGMPTISPVDFARLILRYTIVNTDDYYKYIQRVQERSRSDEKGVSLEQWAKFSIFLNNLEEFTTAVRLYTNADISVSPEEFTRAVESTIGQRLDPVIVNLIFRIFDANNDGTLSYSEFLAVMNDRLHRGLRGRLEKQYTWKAFKNCVVSEISRS